MNRSRRHPLWAHLPQLRPEALQHVAIGVLAASCGITLALVLWFGGSCAARALRSHRYFAVSAITIEGNHWVDRDEILQWAGILEGTSIWEASPATLRARLLSHPRIERVHAWREFPNRLMIQVRERRPAAIVRLDGLQYVDRRGHMLGPLRDEDSRDYPLITGLEGAEVREFVAIGVHHALRLSRLCERTRGMEGVSEIHVDRHAGVTMFSVRTAAAVVLGWGEWREKLARSARVFAAWGDKAVRLAAVDVSFRDMVVVRLRAEHQPAALRTPRHGLRV